MALNTLLMSYVVRKFKNAKGGAGSPAEFNVGQHIAGVRFRFSPDSTNLDDLTSKAPCSKRCAKAKEFSVSLVFFANSP